jgi:hypothetical protein
MIVDVAGGAHAKGRPSRGARHGAAFAGASEAAAEAAHATACPTPWGCAGTGCTPASHAPAGGKASRCQVTHGVTPVFIGGRTSAAVR